MCLALVSLIALVLVSLPLSLSLRRNITGLAARSWFLLSGVRLSVHGRANLATNPAVAVANHASYIDGIILNAILPGHFGFVIKREVTRAPFVHFLLRRIGSHFVERDNRFRGGKDARNILNSTSSGGSVAIFPEGTFTEKPGLAPFRAGAFAAAVAGNAPVIPIVIKGSRQILPADRLLPWPGRLEITVLDPVQSTAKGREAMRQLADKSRAAILELLEEPDLTA